MSIFFLTAKFQLVPGRSVVTANVDLTAVLGIISSYWLKGYAMK